MPRTYLVFVWHMHQPFYKDLASGEYQLPWTRMHALKDYYGMVKILGQHPKIHQTFNLVPSMILQIEEYAAGVANDKFLRVALKPAEELTADEQSFLLKYFFQANHSRMIYRYARYGELLDAWRAAEYNTEAAQKVFDTQAYRDLQVLSQLAWFDEEFQEHDQEIVGLLRKQRGYSREDQSLMGRKQLELLARVMPVYQEFASKGQIEISITPFYHPILPLLCDTDIASVSHPNVALPRRFAYPQDARLQIERARDFAISRFGTAPKGMWPSEGSVSDEAIALAADAGFEWMATDNGVLGATLQRIAGVDETYRPWIWKQNERSMKLLFRDHFLSDLIGFVYSRMDAGAAASHFLDRIRENCRPIHAQGRDALVPIILDGENAWEHYERNGRPFFQELYSRISASDDLEALTVSEALDRLPCSEISRIHPGSWINANYDVWIGAEEDNQAWNFLLDARETYDRVLRSKEGKRLPEEKKRLAFEELLIAEGSDWNWWYGPEHHSENREEFDKLFRDHLAQVYRALGMSPPEALSRPILRIHAPARIDPPTSLIHPQIDGLVSSYFEWLGAGLYSPDQRQGAMHGQEHVVRGMHYGSDGQRLFLRLDLQQDYAGALAGTEFRIRLESGARHCEFTLLLASEGAELISGQCAEAAAQPRCEIGYRAIFELALDLGSIQADPTAPLGLQLSLWRDGLPIDAVPRQGWVQFTPAEAAE
jgi:alpha-amylase/alpha-mannosidase (GH57 family)